MKNIQYIENNLKINKLIYGVLRKINPPFGSITFPIICIVFKMYLSTSTIFYISLVYPRMIFPTSKSNPSYFKHTTIAF